MESFKGKFLARKSKLPNGKKVVILTGVAFTNEDWDQISDNDEMWVMECLISDRIRFYRPNSESGNFSPEDFLANHDYIQHPMNWRRKDMSEEDYRKKYEDNF